ncbi:uracil-DNA glycosylase family protein [Maribacter sp. CXY002]|uniref:uracil-DNA glycosylase family protein n=1 Tax=Maribacter luteocoastalis TaxID=3407671 RepID=UPI003B683EAC
MFKHIHPYEPFIFKEATKLIVGTLPPPRFTSGELKEGDVDFCYGSRDGQLWPILNVLFDLKLGFENTYAAIEQRKKFLKSRKIGICDIVASAERVKMDASDVGMQNVKLRNLLGYLEQYSNVDTLLFTGGNSKNGPEYFFRKHLKENNLALVQVTSKVPRIHQFMHPKTKSSIQTVSLIAPSGAANRAIGSLPDYKRIKSENPKFTTIDFRIMQYSAFF